MPIKKIPIRKPWMTYLRALAVSTLKNFALNSLLVIGVLLAYRNVPNWLFGYGFMALYLFVTYLFAEWTFDDPRLRLRRAIGITLAVYAWDTLVSILIWSRLANENLFSQQRLANHLIYFSLHVLAMLGAWYNRKRFRVKMSLAEGLEA